MGCNWASVMPLIFAPKIRARPPPNGIRSKSMWAEEPLYPEKNSLAKVASALLTPKKFSTFVTLLNDKTSLNGKLWLFSRKRRSSAYGDAAVLPAAGGALAPAPLYEPAGSVVGALAPARL